MDTLNNTCAIQPNFVVKTIINKLDPRMKRLVYVTSLMAIISNNKFLDNQILIKINNELELANAEISSLKLPALICENIWTNKSIIIDDIEYLKKNNLKTKLCIDKIKNIISCTPDWIKYDTEDNLLKDISKLFSFKEELVSLAY